MKHFTLLTLVAVMATAIVADADADIRGTWAATADVDTQAPDKIQFHFNRRYNHTGQTMRLGAFSGLTMAQVQADQQTPVRFELRREAGVATMDGYFRNGEGVGHFTFVPNRNYMETLRSLGVRTESTKHRDRDEEDTLFSYALHDVSTQFIRDMQSEGYNVSAEEYLSARIFRVNRELLAELRELGYRNIPFDDLISMQVHKVTPQYIREMRAAGYNLSLDDLVTSRIHKVTPDFMKQMADLGYRNLDFDDATSFRIHKVTPEFVRELKELGYADVRAEKLVEMRIHRVTPQFIRELKDAGYSGIPVNKLIEMRIHGIDADFVKRMGGIDKN